MREKGRNVWLALALTILSISAISHTQVFAQVFNVPSARMYNPIIDGSEASFAGEYTFAIRIPLTYEWVYFQHKKNWSARSVQTGNSAIYPDETVFGVTIIWGNTTKEIYDYYFFWYVDSVHFTPGANMSVWIFAEGDDPDDSDWIGGSGLGYTSINDTGFLVRKDNIQATDRHWLPGQPEPGDLGWNWATYYHTFASSYTRDGWIGHEKYEWAWYGLPGPCVSFDFSAGNPSNVWFGALHLLSPPSVGGYVIPVDKLALLAPYIALASTIVVATAATTMYVKRVKLRKEKR